METAVATTPTTPEQLYPITADSLAALGLTHVSVWTAYRLLRAGALSCVRVGRRYYLTHSGVARFVAAGGERVVAGGAR